MEQPNEGHMNDRANALVSVSIPSLTMSEAELVAVLKGSVYPGAKDESIKLAIGYCKAQQLDPMLKPVHIVPMDVPTGRKTSEGWDETEKRDVVMPGIGLYRIQASRTGQHAGTSDPEFGPDTTTKLGDTEITFPSWCRVTVRRALVSGAVAEFSATERWLENYATKGRSKKDPNKMWAKRPYAQLAKCAEAQALRKGFPEIGSQPTAEEMAGKSLADVGDGVTIDAETGEITNKGLPQIGMPRKNGAPKHEASASTEPVSPASGAAGGSTADTTSPAPAGGSGQNGEDSPLTQGERNHIKAKLEGAKLTEEDLMRKFGVGLDGLTKSMFKPTKEWIAAAPQ